MTEREFDVLLRDALIEAAEADAQAAWKVYQDSPIPHSARYLRWEKRLLADPFGFARREDRPQWLKALRTAAIAAVITALLLGGALAISPTLRAWVVQWIMQEETTHTTHRFTSPVPGEGGYTHENLPDNVRPSFIPEGYEETRCDDLAGWFSVTYENAEGERLIFDYQTIEEGRAMSVNSEYHTTWETERNGMRVYAAQSTRPEQNASYIIWVNEPMNVTFFVSGKVDMDTLFDIMDSVPTIF